MMVVYVGEILPLHDDGCLCNFITRNHPEPKPHFGLLFFLLLFCSFYVQMEKKYKVERI
jgi:hypothetical protein